MDKLQIKQISGKPAVKYSDIEPGVVFTFNNGSIYGETAQLKTMGGRVNLGGNCPHKRNSADTAEALCTVYKSTLTMEV